MSVEENKAIFRRGVEEIWHQGHWEVIDELYAANYVYHNPGVPMEAKGPEGYKQLATVYRNAFPDIHFTIEDLIAEGDQVVGRWTSTGTQQGDLPDLPATGKQVTLTGITIIHIEAGKIVEEHVIMDVLGMMQQLGVIPTPEGSGE